LFFGDFFQIFLILGNRTTYRASATSALIHQSFLQNRVHSNQVYFK